MIMNTDFRFYHNLYASASSHKISLDSRKMQEASLSVRKKIRDINFSDTKDNNKRASLEDLLDELTYLTNCFHSLKIAQNDRVPSNGADTPLVVIIKEIDGLIYYMEQEATQFFNYNRNIPDSMFAAAQANCSATIPEIIKTLKKHEIDETLIDVVISPCKCFLNLKSQETSFHCLFFMKVFHAGILRLKSYEKHFFNSNLSVIQLLISLNLNSQFFINFLSAFLQAELEEKDSVHQKLEHLYVRRKSLSVVVEKNKYLYDKRREPVMITIQNHMNEEIKLYKISIKLNGLLALNHKESGSRLQTSLTVSVLAVLCKILLSLKIIQTDKEITLFKAISSVLKTEKSEHISPQSLKNKSTAYDEKTLLEAKKVIKIFGDEIDKLHYELKYK